MKVTINYPVGSHLCLSNWFASLIDAGLFCIVLPQCIRGKDQKTRGQAVGMQQ